MLLTSILVAIAVGGFFWWRLPYVQRQHLYRKYEKEIATGEIKHIDLEKLADDYRKTVSQAITAALILFSAVVAFEQMLTARQQAERLEENTQFAKGFELIASEKVYQRVGGISALRELAENSKQKYQPVARAMTSFVIRQTAGERRLRANCQEYLAQPKYKARSAMPVVEDVQEALDVLKRRPTGLALDIDLSGAGLSFADLQGVDFSHAHLAFVDLSGANLEKANFEGADIYCANFYRANLTGAKFKGAQSVDALYIGATVDGADFSNADLLSANFSEIAPKKDVDFSGANLESANFYKGKLGALKVTPMANLLNACFGEVSVLPSDVSIAQGWNGSSEFYTPADVELPLGRCHPAASK